jgi:sulfur carrier protein ThiS
MKIFIEKSNKNLHKKNFKGTAKQLLTQLKINSESVLIVKNNVLITEDEMLDEKDDIKILSVISGG